MLIVPRGCRPDDAYGVTFRGAVGEDHDVEFAPIGVRPDGRWALVLGPGSQMDVDGLWVNVAAAAPVAVFLRPSRMRRG